MLANMVKRPTARLEASARREQLLDCALTVFARTGLHGTGTRDLARAAKVTEPVLYRHFRGKEALFAAVLEVVAERLSTALAAALGGAAVLGERLEALAAAVPRLLQEQEDELRVLCGAAVSHAGPAQQRAVRQALQTIGTVLVHGLQGGGLRRPVSARFAAWFLLEVGLGAALLRSAGVPAVLEPAFSRQLVQLLTTALGG